MNEACISELSWKLKCREEALWCQILKQKYKRKGINGNVLEVKPYDLSFLKHMAKD